MSLKTKNLFNPLIHKYNMETETSERFYYVIIFFLFAIIIILIVLNTRLTQTQSTSQVKELEQCSSLYYNGENRIDIVFFGSQEKSKEWADYFLKSEPINQYKESFNFYYISDYEPECELYQNIAILCHSRDLIKKAASCPNDYIIVLKEDSPGIRSSSYKNVMSINTAHPKTVLLHEFGHAFANLAEEYTPAQIPRGSKNCVAQCTQFPEEPNIDGCFQECSRSNYYRSIAEGVMRTLNTGNFGILNKNIITNLVEREVKVNFAENAQTITGRQASDFSEQCEDKTYTIAEFSINDGSIELTEKPKDEFTGCTQDNSGDGEFYQQNEEEIYFGTDIFTDAQSLDNSGIEGQVFDTDKLFLQIDTTNNPDEVKIFDFENNLLETVPLYQAGASPCEA